MNILASLLGVTMGNENWRRWSPGDRLADDGQGARLSHRFHSSNQASLLALVVIMVILVYILMMMVKPKYMLAHWGHISTFPLNVLWFWNPYSKQMIKDVWKWPTPKVGWAPKQSWLARLPPRFPFPFSPSSQASSWVKRGLIRWCQSECPNAMGLLWLWKIIEHLCWNLHN